MAMCIYYRSIKHSAKIYIVRLSVRQESCRTDNSLGVSMYE